MPTPEPTSEFRAPGFIHHIIILCPSKGSSGSCSRRNMSVFTSSLPCPSTHSTPQYAHPSKIPWDSQSWLCWDASSECSPGHGGRNGEVGEADPEVRARHPHEGRCSESTWWNRGCWCSTWHSTPADTNTGTGKQGSPQGCGPGACTEFKATCCGV